MEEFFGGGESGEWCSYLAVVSYETAIKISKAEEALKLFSGGGKWSFLDRLDLLWRHESIEWTLAHFGCCCSLSILIAYCLEKFFYSLNLYLYLNCLLGKAFALVIYQP